MNVNQKGAVGLIEVIRDLTKKGFECFTPIHDYSSVDLIALTDEKEPIRLQVKYRTTYRNTIGIGFNSVVNGKKVPIDLSYIDGWAIYCPEIEQVVYVNKKDINLSLGGFSFRLTEGKNTVSNGVKLPLYTEFKSLESWVSWLKPPSC